MTTQSSKRRRVPTSFAKVELAVKHGESTVGTPREGSLHSGDWFGRFAAQHRSERGLPKPETFDFLGFTHICGKTRDGRFWLRRITIQSRMRAKLKRVKTELKRRRHLPVPEQGRWLASVVRGHLAYYAVPGNIDAVGTFQRQAGRCWLRALRCRSQRHRLTWQRMSRLIDRWLPPVRIVHPQPSVRFDARTRGRSPMR